MLFFRSGVTEALYSGLAMNTPRCAASISLRLRALMALRQVLEQGCGALVIPEQVTVFKASEAFDEMDNLKDERAAASLKRVAQRLADAAREIA